MRGHKIPPLLRRDATANPVVIRQKSEVNNWLPCTLWSLACTRALDWTVLEASNYASLCHTWQMTGNSSCRVDGPGQETEAEGIVTRGRRSLRVCAVQAAACQGGQRLKYTRRDTKQWKGDGRAKPPPPPPLGQTIRDSPPSLNGVLTLRGMLSDCPSVYVDCLE